MAVSATTVGTRLPREVLLRSPWLARCLAAPEGSVLSRSLNGDGDEEEEYRDEAQGDGANVTCRRACRPEALELGLPMRGAGQRLLAPGGALQCLDLVAPDAVEFDTALASGATLLSHFLWAVVLELGALVAVCRKALIASVDAATVALALAAGHATNDEELLRRCYWCLRETMCGAAGVPAAWLDGRGPVKLSNGSLAQSGVCSTPLRVLAGVVGEDLSAKRLRWNTPTDCYTLCQVHRIRSASGTYPHIYEMRLDHSDELVMRALREDEQSSCRIFNGTTDPATASDHCEDYLGCVVPNFWGTVFTLYDSGTDVESLASRSKASTQLPHKPRSVACTVGYETNLLGDCPRKVTVDFERGTTRHHMENAQPRWDKKLNSYALPFFGRVKKASAKNFQLIVDGDSNTIFLMFGKISKDVFCLDYRGPLAPLDAMAIAIAALAKKRAVS